MLTGSFSFAHKSIFGTPSQHSSGNTADLRSGMLSEVCPFAWYRLNGSRSNYSDKYTQPPKGIWPPVLYALFRFFSSSFTISSNVHADVIPPTM